MDGFLANVIKYLLFATNFLILLMGCVVLGFGIYALAAGKDLVDLVKDGDGDAITLYSSAAILLIIISLFIIIVTFFGCCGALKENKCMLGTYFAIVLVFFIILVVAAIIGYTQSIDKMSDPLRKSMKNYGNPNKTRITTAWDSVQEAFKCCGHDKLEDWQNTDILVNGIPKFGDSTERVPMSCCKEAKGKELTKDEITACQKDPGNKEKYDFKGCYTKLKDSVNNHKSKILGVAITILVVMFLNMLFAFALCTMAK